MSHVLNDSEAAMLESMAVPQPRRFRQRVQRWLYTELMLRQWGNMVAAQLRTDPALCNARNYGQADCMAVHFNDVHDREAALKPRHVRALMRGHWPRPVEWPPDATWTGNRNKRGEPCE